MPLRTFTARALSVGAAATALAAGAAGCGSSSSSADSGSTPAAMTSTAAGASSAALTPVKAGVVEVAYKNYAIDPEEIVVKAGQEIKWTNYDTSRHNVVVKDGAPEAFKSADFDKGQTATFTPKKPGVYSYLCTFHAGSMQGKITVQG